MCPVVAARNEDPRGQEVCKPQLLGQDGNGSEFTTSYKLSSHFGLEGVVLCCSLLCASHKPHVASTSRPHGAFNYSRKPFLQSPGSSAKAAARPELYSTAWAGCSYPARQR